MDPISANIQAICNALVALSEATKAGCEVALSPAGQAVILDALKDKQAFRDAISTLGSNLEALGNNLLKLLEGVKA